MSFRHHSRELKLIFLANLISMIGSGMNSAAVILFLFERTGSEISLGVLMMLQTLPALLLLPASGVIIDRNDRRFLVMFLDCARFLAVAFVAFMAIRGHVRLWHVYAMYILVSAGFWMFWPTINALVQELSPEDRYVNSNALLNAGIQGGFIVAGSVVGFLYHGIGLGGCLAIDACSYLLSFGCYFLVRRGKHLVVQPPRSVEHEALSSIRKLLVDAQQGISYLRAHPQFLPIGLCWSLFLSAMMSQGVITAPLSERILHTGAVGFGWLNAAWGVGAFLSALYATRLIRNKGAQRVTQVAVAVMAAGLVLGPASHFLAIAALIWFTIGSARGLTGISLSTEFMERIPKHLMGRVQNLFYLLGTALQLFVSLAIGAAAHRISLTLGFYLVAALYASAFLMASVPQHARRLREDLVGSAP